MTILLLAAVLAQSPMDAPVRSPAPSLLLREEPYHGGPIPENARVARNENTGLVVGGAIIGGGAYMLSAGIGVTFGTLIAAASDDLQLLTWVIPLAGPFIGMAVGRNENNRGTWMIIHGISGSLQLIGTAMFILGMATRSTVLVYDDAAPAVSFAPLILEDGGGVAAALRF